jgi:FAD binding domain
VRNVPQLTFLPTTVVGVQNLVRYAASQHLRVRCGGYRHSWSDIFGQTNEIFISFVNLAQVTITPDPLSIQPEYLMPVVLEFKTIELKEISAPGKRLCRVGVAVTNEEFRRWAVANNAWSLPVDVILVEVTIGGVNGPICHGAGFGHKTISDYVRRVEYVDCNGDIQIVDDSYLIKAAAGAFGLLGVVTHITFELDAMTYAVMEPRKVDIGLAIPPLSKDLIPAALRSAWLQDADADTQMSNALADFEKRAENDYYSEWFWFPYQRKAWVNTWNTTQDSTDLKEYPSEGQTLLQWVGDWLGGIVTQLSFFQALPGYWQAQLMATLGMATLAPTLGEDLTPSFKTSLPNALHFRRGIQNMRVRDMEFQIPIPSRTDDESRPDFDVVRRAWWDVINLVYDESNQESDVSSPMRLTLEMRIMGGSDVTMAPQRGNKWGTASIEVLTTPDTVSDGEWNKFIQRVADKWMSYGQLNVRPHWAKEWQGVRFRGMEATEYLRTVAYKDQISEFRHMLEQIGKPHGWGLEELQKRFSNELWDGIIYNH